MRASYLLDLVPDLFISHVVLVGNLQDLSVASHHHCLDSLLKVCCKGPCLTSIQEDGCDKGAHQSNFRSEGNVVVIPYGPQPCQCQR